MEMEEIDIPKKLPSKVESPEITLIEKLQARQKQLAGGSKNVIELTAEEAKVFEKFNTKQAIINNRKKISKTNKTSHNSDRNEGTSENVAKSTEEVISYDDLEPTTKVFFWLLDNMMYIIPLVSIHFVLDVFVYQEYREEVDYNAVFTRALKAFILFITIYATIHKYRENPIIKACFTIISMGAGCYLVYCVNEMEYFAKLFQAAPIGTLIAYLYMELDWYFSALSAIVIVGWTLFNDYTFF